MIDSNEIGRDLTDLARRGKLDPIVGRESEMDQLLGVLCRRTKSNPLLIGEPGVGKTALCDGLALRIVAGKVPRNLLGRRVFELQLGALLAGTQFRGDLEQRVHAVLKSAQVSGTLVFIDEIHLLVQAGKGSGLDVGNLLKPALARGDFSCIGATTPSEAAEFFRADPAFERRFQTILIEEPDATALRSILHEAARKLGAYHNIVITDSAVEAALRASCEPSSVSSGRKNPDRALDLLEDACALEQLRRCRVETDTPPFPPEIVALRNELTLASMELNIFRHIEARDAYENALTSWSQGNESRIVCLPTLDANHIEAMVRTRIPE